MGGRHTIQSKKVNDTFKSNPFGGSGARPATQGGATSALIDLHEDVDEKRAAPSKNEGVKQTDILTLKKMVIEEIKSELQLTGAGKG